MAKVAGTMFYGFNPTWPQQDNVIVKNMVQFSAFQFGSNGNDFWVQVIQKNSNQDWEHRTYIAKQNGESLPLYKEMKAAYRQYQQDESRAKKQDEADFYTPAPTLYKYQQVFDLVSVRNLSDYHQDRLSKYPTSIRGHAKSQFKNWVRAIDGCSFEVIKSGFYKIQFRSFRPINFTTNLRSLKKKDTFQNKKFLNKMASVK